LSLFRYGRAIAANLRFHPKARSTSDQPISLQPLKGDKQRACIETENALAQMFEPDGNPISVHGFERQRFQNEPCPAYP